MTIGQVMLKKHFFYINIPEYIFSFNLKEDIDLFLIHQSVILLDTFYSLKKYKIKLNKNIR